MDNKRYTSIKKSINPRRNTEIRVINEAQAKSKIKYEDDIEREKITKKK